MLRLGMKLPALGPECMDLIIRRHSNQTTHIRLEGLGGLGCLPVGCCEDELSWLARTQMTVASWIWTWTFKISRSTVPSRKRPATIAIQTDFLLLNAFWSSQNMTKHISDSKCFQIVQLLVLFSVWEMRFCFVLLCPGCLADLRVKSFLVVHQSSVALPRCQIWDSLPRPHDWKSEGWRHGGMALTFFNG